MKKEIGLKNVCIDLSISSRAQFRVMTFEFRK